MNLMASNNQSDLSSHQESTDIIQRHTQGQVTGKFKKTCSGIQIYNKTWSKKEHNQIFK